uniref:Uncharacterized protein n=1 Tax=Panagrolaimus davidi TaxID=227884 RepID=A0A914P5U2_9BILA
MLVQEVAAPTPKYNLTQNDNSPTENLDRKILAFEINSHNRKVFEELQKKKSAAIAAKILENPEFNFEEEIKAETPVFSTTTITPVPAANEVQIDESKKLLNEVSFNGSPKTLTTSLPSIIQEATKKEVENAPENSATSESKAQESIHTPEQLTQPNEPENANEQIPTLTATIPVEAEAGVIESEVNVKNAESPTEGDVQFSKAASEESSPEVPDHIKHQTEVPAATPITEAAGSHSREELTTPQTSFPEGDFILPENSEALHQAELLAEANAAKVGSLQFPSQLPSIFYEKASQKKKVPKISQQQQQPPPPHQETQPPPPPPPTDAQIQGFLLPHRPILDSSVQKRRHLISNYIDPIQRQKSAQFQQKQEFFRKSAVIARERSRRETKPEQTTVTYEDDVIDEADSEESNIIVRLTNNAEEDNPTTTTADKNVEDITATTASVESSTSITRDHQLKLVSKKNGSKKDVLDSEVQKSTVILENEEHATTAAESKTSESTDSASSSTIESTKPSEATITTDESSIPSEATTAKPIKKPKISKALTREEKLALLESQSPRTGINLGKIHLPKKSSTEAIDASAEPQDPENPWTHRFKSHIQLKLTDESREVVERTELKVLPKLISPEVLKAQKKAEREAKKKAKKEAEEEELEFKDLPEPRSGDLKVDVDVVTKPATKSATLLTTTVTPTTSRSRVPQQLQQQIPQNFFVRPQQQFQQQPQQQFFQQQQQQFFHSQQQQIFPQQRTQFPQQRIISIDGVRYILRDPAPQQQFFQPPPQQFFQPQQFQQQQQQFFQPPPPPQPLRAPPSHSPPPTQQPSINSTPKIKPHRIIHSGNAKQFSTTPASTTPTLGPRVNPEDLSVVRIFQHRGTTKQIFATTPAPTTRPPSTTAFVTESTTQWIPVTFTTHPTPTTPFDIFLVTTAAPIPNSRVKTHRDLFEVYDEVEFSDPVTTTSKPKKIKKPLPRRSTPPSTKSHDPSDFDLISEVAQEQSFRDIPLRHPPHDPPSTNFEDYFDDQQRKSLRRKQPKLVRLNNSNAAVSQKAADFIGDVPIAKSDLRGLDKTIALNS